MDLRFTEPRRLSSAPTVGISLDTGPQGASPVVAAADGRFLAARRVPGDPYDGVLVVESWWEEFGLRPR